MRVLVAHATKYGSTEGVAKRIGAKLTSFGFAVDVLPVGDVGRLEQYEGFVIGSAVYAFHWMKPAAKFVRVHREALAAHPVWLFSVGPLGPEQAEPVKPRDFGEINAHVGARGHQIFYGAMDISKLRGPDRLLSPMFKSTQGDFRDWDAIDAWALLIARELAPVAAGPAR